MQHCIWFAILLIALDTAKWSEAQEIATSQSSIWNLSELKTAPKMRWLTESGAIRSLIYSGQKMDGRDTEVFAFYASPKTLDPTIADTRFPGVVLIHGGGGTAFADWTWMWAKRGYAAIAMDLSGTRPIDPVYDAAGTPIPKQAAKPESRTRLILGGPALEFSAIFDRIGGTMSDDWPYHAIGNAILAHSLLRSFSEVIADRTAVTGISWGGYTTCIVASLYDRFRAAVPVYGCWYLYEGESVQKGAIDQLGERRAAWIEAYDPSRYLLHCSVPILFVNGTNDVHYPLDSYQKSYEAVRGEKQIRIEVDMKHGHTSGWTPKEIEWFIDSRCRDAEPLPKLGGLVVAGEKVIASTQSVVPIQSVAIHYTSDSGLRSSRTWKSIEGKVESVSVSAPTPPSEANTWFLSVTDERGAMVSSPIQFQK